MIQVQTELLVADNTGAKKIECIFLRVSFTSRTYINIISYL